jgi:hypothetical protein
MHVNEHSQLDDRDRLLNKIAELSENLHHRLSLDSLNLVESYQKGNLSVIVRANIREIDFLYTFTPMPNGSLPGLGNRAMDSARSVTHLDEVGVFVDQIKIMKDSEETSIPSIAWLQRGNGVAHEEGNFLAFFPERGFEPLFIRAMGEIRLLRRTTRQLGAARHRLIEGGPEIVESAGGAQLHIAGSWWHRREYNFQFPRFGIALGNALYHVGFREGFEGKAVILDVAFGPFNL